MEPENAREAVPVAGASDEWCWPADLTNRKGKRLIAEWAAARIAQLSPQRRVVVQAGGCSGLWPVALAQHFERVYTFEPAPHNFECLRQNIARVPNIKAFNCALGDRPRRAALAREKPQAGMWEVTEAHGDTSVVRLDDVLGGSVIDALVLDVEGSELAAWTGAERLVVLHRPLMWFEFNRNVAALDAWLVERGYSRPKAGIGRDWFSVYPPPSQETT